MRKRNFFLTNAQDAFLRSLDGSVSEHIRRAVDEYIERKRNVPITISPSRHGTIYKRKKGAGNTRA